MQESLEIISAVNNFYSQSFGQLITITLGFLAFIGVFLPILLTFYQKRLVNLEQTEIEAMLTKRLGQIESSLQEKLDRDLAEKDILLTQKISNSEEKLQERVSHALSGVLFVQGSLQLSNKLYWLASYSFVRAAKESIKANEEGNLKKALRLIIVNCSPNMTEQNYTEAPYEEVLDGFLEMLSHFNHNNRYTDEINQLKVLFEKFYTISNKKRTS
ncbi:hypothetical protein [Thiomicrospira pelophila]|uniref:hypothetical protein n=1 Tax=Thiomicrospira pelophila TaxID=934 RepID=UPI0004A75E9D|nr:hypothetical protein [Thiomicrospira pelophila]